MRRLDRTDRRGARSRAGWAAGLCAALLHVLAARPAAAQEKPPADEREARAQSLFDAGVAAMRAGRYETACPDLSESHRLSPSAGALFTLAECEAARGKVATAVERYQSFVSQLASMPASRRAKFEERRRIAVRKIAALTPLSSELSLSVSSAAPADLVLRCNGAVVPASEYGVSKKVDPGEYALSAELHGERVWERRITLGPRGRARVEVPPPSAAIPPPSAAVPPPAPPSRDEGNAARTIGYVVGSVGVLGLATGIASGAVALSQKGTIEKNCPDLACNPEGRRAVTTGQSAALVSTISFPVGLAGLAGAAILFLVARPAPGKAPAWQKLRPGAVAAEHGVMVSLEGVF